MRSPARGWVVGVDLSGPANTADTAAACFRLTASGPTLESLELGLGDAELVARIEELQAAPGGCVVGLDAPLAYNPGGGLRRSDRSLQSRLRDAGCQGAAWVMTPTMNRMVYLTLRGIAVARALAQLRPAPAVVEVHPGASLALRGTPVDDLRSLKTDAEARSRLLGWLGKQGLQGLPGEATDHEVAACACALAALEWSRGEPVWLYPAEPPLHPHDFVC